MTPLVMAFPAIDPEILRIGPFALRWYALAYIAGIVIGWRLALRAADAPPRHVTRAQVEAIRKHLDDIEPVSATMQRRAPSPSSSGAVIWCASALIPKPSNSA